MSAPEEILKTQECPAIVAGMCAVMVGDTLTYAGPIGGIYDVSAGCVVLLNPTDYENFQDFVDRRKRIN